LSHSVSLLLSIQAPSRPSPSARRRPIAPGCRSFSQPKAEAHAKGGRSDTALNVIEEALSISDETGERWAVAEVLRVKAGLLQATGRATADENREPAHQEPGNWTAPASPFLAATGRYHHEVEVFLMHPAALLYADGPGRRTISSRR